MIEINVINVNMVIIKLISKSVTKLVTYSVIIITIWRNLVSNLIEYV